MDKGFYSENRRKVAAHMTGNDAMLFFSGEPVRKSADEKFPFFTNRNFLYLRGIKQEQSALLLLKKGDVVSECMFVTKPDFEREIWTGRRLTEEEIHEISGVAGIEDIEREFAKHIRDRYSHILIRNSYPLLAAMCKVKARDEIDAIRKAVQITEAGIRRMMQVAKPGLMEYELEAHSMPNLQPMDSAVPLFRRSLREGSASFICTMRTPCLR